MQSPFEIWTAHKLNIERLLIANPNGTGLRDELKAAEDVLDAIAKGTHNDPEMSEEFLESIGDLTSKIAEIAKPPEGNHLEFWTGQKPYDKGLLDTDDDIYTYGETAAEIDRSVFLLPFNFAKHLDGWTIPNLYGQRTPDEEIGSPAQNDGLDDDSDSTL